MAAISKVVGVLNVTLERSQSLAHPLTFMGRPRLPMKIWAVKVRGHTHATWYGSGREARGRGAIHHERVEEDPNMPLPIVIFAEPTRPG